ncbi:probable G-protein coupled receptor 139 [Scyliorhinus torazame]|uniref:probable G-protein coupled receptor 139 n=1 Tax=Scyliorhinus torazame TaxID=75743 RepID=UPI003B5A5F2C
MGSPVLDKVKSIYYPILATIGVPVNFVAMVILSRRKCGLSKCVTRYLVAMAATDLLVVVTDVIIRCTIGIYFPGSFLSITTICRINAVLLFAVTEASVWFTVAFTFDRFVAICCQKLKTKYCTDKVAAVVLGVLSALSLLQSIPWYFVFIPEYIIAGVPRGCAMKQAFYTDPTWGTFEVIHLVLTPCVPFILILMLNALTARHILVASRVRTSLKSHKSATPNKDPEIGNGKKSIVLLFSVSGTFILLWSTEVGYFISLHVSDSQYFVTSDLEAIGVMLQLLSTCTNACIYGVTQRKFREELRNGIKYPLQLIAKLLKA